MLRLKENYAPVQKHHPKEDLIENVKRELEKSKLIEIVYRREFPSSYGMTHSQVDEFCAKQADDFFQTQLVRALEKERSFDPNWIVLYHAASGSMSFYMMFLQYFTKFQATRPTQISSYLGFLVKYLII